MQRCSDAEWLILIRYLHRRHAPTLCNRCATWRNSPNRARPETAKRWRNHPLRLCPTNSSNTERASNKIVGRDPGFGRVSSRSHPRHFRGFVRRHETEPRQTGAGGSDKFVRTRSCERAIRGGPHRRQRETQPVVGDASAWNHPPPRSSPDIIELESAGDGIGDQVERAAG